MLNIIQVCILKKIKTTKHISIEHFIVKLYVRLKRSLCAIKWSIWISLRSSIRWWKKEPEITSEEGKDTRCSMSSSNAFLGGPSLEYFKPKFKVSLSAPCVCSVYTQPSSQQYNQCHFPSSFILFFLYVSNNETHKLLTCYYGFQASQYIFILY